MSVPLPTLLPQWLGATPDHLEALGRSVASRLPGITFTGVEPTTERSLNALFEADGTSFAFVPGGAGRLGYARELLSLSPPEQRLLCTSGEFDTPGDIASALEELGDTLERCTSPRRAASVGPLLVEVEALRLDERVVPPSEPLHRRVLEEARRDEQGVLRLDGFAYRVERSPAGGSVQIVESATRASLATEFARLGARLLTEDEWEWAAGGGVDTLYRWGNQVPVAEQPTGQDTGEEKPELLEPNRFGLIMGWHPYDWELCEGWLKGGDGGGAWCGGEGTLAIWSSLMLPRREPVDSSRLPAARRCIAVPSLE